MRVVQNQSAGPDQESHSGQCPELFEIRERVKTRMKAHLVFQLATKAFSSQLEPSPLSKARRSEDTDFNWYLKRMVCLTEDVKPQGGEPHQLGDDCWIWDLPLTATDF
jgi:hypothetical protein